MPGAILLSYVKDREKEEQLQKLCKRLNIANIRIGQKDMEKEMPELLVFSGIPEGMLDLILAEYRKEKIEPVALKAMVTPHNISWTVYELSSELAKEHAAMHHR